MNFIARKLIMPGFWCSMVGAALALVVTDVLQALSQIYRHGSAAFAAAAALTGRELLLIVPLAPLLYLPLHWIYRAHAQRIHLSPHPLSLRKEEPS